MTMPEVTPLLEKIGQDIRNNILGNLASEPAMVGIHTGGGGFYLGVEALAVKIVAIERNVHHAQRLF